VENEGGTHVALSVPKWRAAARKRDARPLSAQQAQTSCRFPALRIRKRHFPNSLGRRHGLRLSLQRPPGARATRDRR
jgi:hypothetical protein